MQPLGYVLQQHGERNSRPVKACAKWAERIPEIYNQKILGRAKPALHPDPHCLASLKHYRSLIPMAQEVRKPIFRLTSADGAIGSHSAQPAPIYRLGCEGGTCQSDALVQAGDQIEAYLGHLAFGGNVIQKPLFLVVGHHWLGLLVVDFETGTNHFFGVILATALL